MADLIDGPHVLCAGDRFISPELLADAVRALRPDVRVTTVASAWPDAPFGDVDGVREAAGDPGELARLAGDADVLLTHLAPVTRAVLAAAPGLRLVASVRGGPVNVDLAAATEAGVRVSYLPGRNLEAAAEYTLGMILAVTRNIGAGNRQLGRGEWDGSWFRLDRTGPELAGATVGLVGLGAIGGRVAELLRAFGSRVLASDPYAGAVDGVELVDLGTLLASSDVVSLHARLTDSTRHLIDAAALARMRPGSYLINTARGELVETAALREAVAAGRLAGVALDVFDPEPPDPADPLLARPDVVVTPHLAGGSQQVATRSAARAAEAVRRFLEDGTVEHLANPEVATR